MTVEEILIVVKSLLEYDDYSEEVIAPNHDSEDLVLPKKCLFTFVGNVVQKYAEENNAELVEVFSTVSHDVNIYVLHEGTSYQYLPASRYIELDTEPVDVIKKVFEKHNLPFVTCTTWTTDGFFRETKDMVKYRLEEGCTVVEMECSALAAVRRKRDAQYGQFLFTADSLSNVHDYDARDFGRDSHEKALLLGLEVLRKF